MSMTNNAGSSTGVQKLGNMAQPATDDEGYGNYNGSKTIAVSSITGKYADRWDDVGYYE
jgi:hypothetical protein